MKPLPRILSLAVIALLAGCATTAPTVPSSPSPTATVTPTAAAPAPAPVIEAKPATLTGSEESSAMLDSFTAFVTAVDGVNVAAGRQGWNTPLPIKAGLRRLSVAFNRGVFAARGNLELKARSEAAYQLKFATDAQLFGKNSYCDFWIVDAATGEPVTERTRVPLTKIEGAK